MSVEYYGGYYLYLKKEGNFRGMRTTGGERGWGWWCNVNLNMLPRQQRFHGYELKFGKMTELRDWWETRKRWKL